MTNYLCNARLGHTAREQQFTIVEKQRFHTLRVKVMTMALSKATKDHDEIRQWAEKRGAKPAEVASTESGGKAGIIRLEFPKAPNANDSNLKEIPWEEWFEKFDTSGLELVYQEVTAEGAESNFNRLIYPENEKPSAKKSSSGRGGSPSKGASSKGASSKGASSKGAGSSKGAAKSTGSSKTASKKSPAKSAPAKKAAAKKAPAKKAPAKQAAKKAPAKKAPAKKAPAKKAPAKKAPAKKAPAKKSSRSR